MTVASGSVGIRLFSRVQMDQTASSVRAAAETHKAVQGCWPRHAFPDPTTSCGQAFWSEEDVGVHFSIRWSDSQAGRYRSKYQRHLLPVKPFLQLGSNPKPCGFAKAIGSPIEMEDPALGPRV